MGAPYASTCFLAGNDIVGGITPVDLLLAEYERL